MDKKPLNTKLKDGTISFEECRWDSIKSIFLTNHYLKSMPAGILSCYGLFDTEKLNRAVGGAVFCNGRIQYDKIYLEFSRLWVDDEFGCNTESWFISKCMKHLKKKFPEYKGVVTWADGERGHTGTVYKAANFIYDGESRKVKKFLGKNKKVIYQRTSIASDVCIGEDEPKRRFIYYFNSESSEKRIRPYINRKQENLF